MNEWIGVPLVVLKVNGVLFPEMSVAFHIHESGVLVDVSENWIVVKLIADESVVCVKDATGGVSDTVM